MSSNIKGHGHDMDAVHEGSCLCGQVHFRVAGAANSTTNCHCRMCQKASGAPYVTWVEFSAKAVRWMGVEPIWRASSDAAERGFCPECGTPVAFVYNQGDDVDLPCVLFDDPEMFTPKDEIWTDSRRSWVVLDTQLLRHARERPEDIS